MKWLVEADLNFDVSAGIDHRNGELCRFLKGFVGVVIDSDASKIVFEREIADKVEELNSRYPAESSITIDWIDVNPKISNDPGFGRYPIACEFHEYDGCYIGHLLLYPILGTYCPKGGEQ